MTDAGLEDGLLGLRVEEVQPLHVDRQPNTVTDADLERGIDTRDKVVRTYLAVQVLVRAQYLEHLDLKVDGGVFFRRSGQKVLGAGAQDASCHAGRPAQLDLETPRLRVMVGGRDAQ